ncbi:hypothetical protein GCM10027049_22940 [Mucilaginibacter puniceus]
MKKGSKFLILLFAVSLFVIADCKAQVYVSKIPVVPKYKLPKKLSKHYVWVTDEWMAGKKKYIYVQGHWAYPPTETSTWVDGFWRKTAKGYIRVNGHWDYGAIN